MAAVGFCKGKMKPLITGKITLCVLNLEPNSVLYTSAFFITVVTYTLTI
jgi:hypothetical protein